VTTPAERAKAAALTSPGVIEGGTSQGLVSGNPLMTGIAGRLGSTAPVATGGTLGGGTNAKGGTVSGSTGGTGTTGGTTSTDPYGGLSGADRDAAAFLQSVFSSYGLGTLAPVIVNYLKQGYSQDTIALLLQQTPEYKTRFAANDQRLKAGLPVLSPAEYIQTENSYRQIMSAAGLPPGFYDSNDDFTKWIAGDVSPTEVQGRVQVASNLIYNADPATLSAFKSIYGAQDSDLVAYALDPTRAEPLVEKQYRAAQIAGQANANNVGLSQSQAEAFAAEGITQSQASQGFGLIGSEQGAVSKLAQIYGQDVGVNDLINAVFDNNGDATNKVNRLASAERGAFGGTSAAAGQSLTRRDAGQI
jgi:hypothetical protein